MGVLLEGVLTDLGITSGGGLGMSGDPYPAVLSSPLAVADCAISSVAACLMAAADLALARTGRMPEMSLPLGMSPRRCAASSGYAIRPVSR